MNMLNSDKGTILERLGVKKKVDPKDLVRKWQVSCPLSEVVQINYILAVAVHIHVA